MVPDAGALEAVVGILVTGASALAAVVGVLPSAALVDPGVGALGEPSPHAAASSDQIIASTTLPT